MLRLPSLNIEHSTEPATIEDTFARATLKRRRMVYLAIPGSIALGLLLAVLYVGGRVVSGRRHAAPAPVQQQAAIVIPPTQAATPARALPPPPQVEKSAPKVEAKPAPVSAPPVVKPVEKPVVKPAAKNEPPPPPPVKHARASDSPLNLITPHHGETYLQLAALTPQTVLKFVDELRANELSPSVAPGPENSGLVRVVVGPFADTAALAKAKEALNNFHLEWIIRPY